MIKNRPVDIITQIQCIKFNPVRRRKINDSVVYSVFAIKKKIYKFNWLKEMYLYTLAVFGQLLLRRIESKHDGEESKTASR